MPCPDEEIPFLQGRSWQSITKFVEQRLLCEQTQPKVGHRCNRIQYVWSEIISFSHSGSAQWISSQLHNFRTSKFGYGNYYAQQSLLDDTRWKQIDSSLRPGLVLPAQTIQADAEKQGYPTKYEPKGKLSEQCGSRKFLRTAQK